MSAEPNPRISSISCSTTATRSAWAFASAYIIALAFVFLFRFRHGKWKSMRVIEPICVEDPELAEVQVEQAG